MDLIRVIRETVLVPTPLWVDRHIMSYASNEIFNQSGFEQSGGCALARGGAAARSSRDAILASEQHGRRGQAFCVRGVPGRVTALVEQPVAVARAAGAGWRTDEDRRKKYASNYTGGKGTTAVQPGS